MIAAAEIDLVRAVYNIDEVQPISEADKHERLYRFFDGAGWCAFHDGEVWRGREVIRRMEQGVAPEVLQAAPDQPRMFLNLAPEVQVWLYRRIRDADRPEDAMTAFIEALSRDAGPAEHLVIKAADQIPVIGLLEQWQPLAPKIAITRDGRDAAISAAHFVEYGRELDAPYKDVQLDYMDLLGNWATRAEEVIALARARRIYVIRYEDLIYDLEGTMRPLLRWLVSTPLRIL